MSCQTCLYWAQEEGETKTFCHRYPPQVIKIGENEDGPVLWRYWPLTKGSDQCGEHTLAC